MRNLVWSFCIVMILATTAFCQAPPDQPLVNESIVDMVQAGLPEEIIITKIQTSPNNFDLSTTGLVFLSKEKVSNNIMKAMMGAPKNAPVAGAAAQVAESGDVNSPDAPHEAGIYLYTKTATGAQMTLLEPTVYTQGKSGGYLASAMTYGIAKMKWKAVVRGAQAQVRCTDPSATFYFYFEKTSAGLSHASYGTSTPNEFTILRFDVKGDSRETLVMTANAFGTSSGSDDKKTIAFDFVKLRPGVYKVTPKAPLTPGEYGIIGSSHGNAFAGGAATASHVFDFGVN
jgi:hypothetical protein